MAEYKLKEVRLHLQGGAILIAEVSSLEAVKNLIKDAEALGLPPSEKEVIKKHLTKPPKETTSVSEDPTSRIEVKAGLESGVLGSARLLAIKDDVPQLLRPNVFAKTTDAVLVLLFAVETGLTRSQIDYESFKGLYDSQNIKSGSPLAMILTNLRTMGYLDKSVYAKDRALRLTAKGENKAIEVLKNASSAR